MKKNVTYILLAVAAIFYTASVQAQMDVDRLRFGLQVSPTISWMSSDATEIEGDGSRLGLNLGFMGEYYFANNDQYALVSGVSLLVNQGGGLKYGFSGNFLPEAAAEADGTPNATTFDTIGMGSTVNYGLQFIEIPISLRLKTSEDLVKDFRFYGELPLFAINFRTGARGSIEGSPNVEDLTISDDVAALNFKWGLGAGVEYNPSPSSSSNFRLQGGIYFTQTLIDVTGDSGTAIHGTNNEEDSKGTINAITIRIGALF